MGKLKKLVLLVTIIASCFQGYAQNDYFFPPGMHFNTSVPSPEEFLGYSIGDFHTRHDLLVNYFRELAEKSDRVHFEIIGYTNEHRPQIVATITSPLNYSRIEEIRSEHLKIADPSSSISSYENMPSIVLLGYNVHGNEPSSAEAAMLTAYWLASSTDEEVKTYLENTVVLVDPVLNPDGRDRHTTWVNSHHGFPPVADPLDREHNEAWPGGRTNHYWFDLNRDWLPLTQVESQNRMKFYHQWLPNVVTDFHEMGANSTYFFEPTEPYGSENPVVPRANYDNLNNIFAKYYEKAMNDIGSLYFTKEVFDNSYPGYGSTYPDIHGGLGMVFEQASSRGHIQKNSTGEIEFRFTIRNHLRSSLATVKASSENKELLLKHQRDFFNSALEEGKKSVTKGYIFGDKYDLSRTKRFISLLNDHQIDVYEVDKDFSTGGTQFLSGASYYVPTAQRQYRMVRTMFEKVTQFYDTVFYDASAWTVALAYGLPYGTVRSGVSIGKKVDEVQFTGAAELPTSSYAWLIDWRSEKAFKALYLLLDQGINVKTARKPFKSMTNEGNVEFSEGSLMISVANQNLNKEDVIKAIHKAGSGVKVYSVSTGLNIQGPDLGSGNFVTVRMPKIIMLIGEGVSSYEAGEKWHVLDTELGMPVAKVDILDFSRINLYDFNTLVLVSGNYGLLKEKDIEGIKEWVNKGGTIIAQRSGVSWVIKNKLTTAELVEKEESEENVRRDFGDASEYRGSQRIGGSIYEADIDTTHPLGYGYTSRKLSVYRNHTIFLSPGKNPYSTVAKYSSNPLLGGYISNENLDKVKNSASVLVTSEGRGRVILMVDNPNFRGFWYGTNRLFFNGIFFGNLIYSPN